MDEATDYLTNGRSDPAKAKGHQLRIDLEQQYLDKLEAEITKRANKSNIMIIEEFLKILSHPNSDEKTFKILDLYDEFIKGRDKNDILILLNSDIDDLRYYGCDILNEINIKDSSLSYEIRKKAYDILKSDSNGLNRIKAFHALYCMYLENKDIYGLFLLCEEMKNNDEIMIKKGAINYLEKYNSVPENINFEEFLNHLYGYK